MSASPAISLAEGIKITLSAPKSVIEGRAGGAVRDWSRDVGGGD